MMMIKITNDAVLAVFLNLSIFKCSINMICFALTFLFSYFLDRNFGKVLFAGWCVGRILFYVLLNYTFVDRDGQ
jgi:hypothetical protein